MKRILVPGQGREVCLGRKRSRANTPHLCATRFMKGLGIAPPESLDLTKPALASLRNIDQNDKLGDCVIAGGYHIVGTATGNAGKLYSATPADIIADYGAIGGYVVGDPSTDQGCDLQTAMNYWVQKGFRNGTKLAGWLAVDPTNKTEIQQILYLFENAFLGIELPDAWISPFPSGDSFTWDLATPDPNNGHCVVGVGYTPKGMTIDTWGMFGTLTWNAIANLCASKDGGEIYVLLTPDMIAKASAKSPAGFDWATLIADFDALGGHVPVPPPAPPAPAPAPPPAPPPAPHPPAPPPTLAQAQAWAAAGLATHWPKH